MEVETGGEILNNKFNLTPYKVNTSNITEHEAGSHVTTFGLTCQFVFYFEHGDQNTYILDSKLSRAKMKHLKVYIVFYLWQQLLIWCQ